MALKVTRREEDGISILDLKGRLTFGPEDMLLNDEIRHALAARTFRLVIDLSGVDKIDSAGLGTLLYARAELRRAGGGLALANLRPAHLKTLRVENWKRYSGFSAASRTPSTASFPSAKCRTTICWNW